MKTTQTETTIKELILRVDSGGLDLQPDFQRGDVWDRTRQRRLIDSILREWHVPPLHVIEDAPGGVALLMDGQQRVRTILAFVRGDLTIDGSIPPSSHAISRLDGLRFNDLPYEAKQEFLDFRLNIVHIYSYEPDEPAELFFRLNQQYLLTPSEKRNALYGVPRDQVKVLVADFQAAGAFQRGAVGFSNDRLAYDDVVARACLAVERGSIAFNIRNAELENFYRNETFSDETTAILRSTTGWLVAALESNSTRLNKATLFSWLMFAVRNIRATGDPFVADPGFLGWVERSRKSLEPRDWSTALLAIYSGRASYRVADAASQVLRDIALALLYEGTPLDAHRDIAGLREWVRNDPHIVGESFLLEEAERVGWDRL